MRYQQIFAISTLIYLSTNLLSSCAHNNSVITRTKTKKDQSMLTPWHALQKLKKGNERFVTATMRKRDHVALVTSSQKQYPFAVILSCMDSRGSPEIIFDQGIGDIFTQRLAGNVINSDVLGGMEFATKISGAKLIAVLGHTSCGAVKGACRNDELGNLTQLLEKIKPAVSLVQQQNPTTTCEDSEALDEMSLQNVRNAIEQIKKNSPVIMSMIKSGEIGLVGGIHNLATGKVTFLEAHYLLPGSP